MRAFSSKGNNSQQPLESLWTEAAEPVSLLDRSRGAGLAFGPKPRSKPRSRPRGRSLEDYDSLCHGVTRTVGDLAYGALNPGGDIPVTSGDKQ